MACTSSYPHPPQNKAITPFHIKQLACYQFWHILHRFFFFSFCVNSLYDASHYIYVYILFLNNSFYILPKLRIPNTSFSLLL